MHCDGSLNFGETLALCKVIMYNQLSSEMSLSLFIFQCRTLAIARTRVDIFKIACLVLWQFWHVRRCGSVCQLRMIICICRTYELAPAAHTRSHTPAQDQPWWRGRWRSALLPAKMRPYLQIVSLKNCLAEQIIVIVNVLRLANELFFDPKIQNMPLLYV